MKTLTLWQPWASLIVWGEKRFETRSWTTSYRGPLAIHAAKHRVGWDMLMDRTIQAVLERNQQQFEQNGLPFGAVLCIVNLTGIIATELIRGDLTDQEKLLGDYSTGRFAWKLDVVEVFDKPIPAKGAQGLWEWKRT